MTNRTDDTAIVLDAPINDLQGCENTVADMVWRKYVKGHNATVHDNGCDSDSDSAVAAGGGVLVVDRVRALEKLRADRNGNARARRAIPLWMGGVCEMVRSGGGDGAGDDGIAVLVTAKDRIEPVVRNLEVCGVRYYVPRILSTGPNRRSRCMFPGVVFYEAGWTAKVPCEGKLLDRYSTMLETIADEQRAVSDQLSMTGTDVLMKFIHYLKWGYRLIRPTGALAKRLGSELQSLERLISVNPFVVPRRGILPGKRVVVTEGVLKGIEGTVVQEKGITMDILQVTLWLFGRSVPVEIKRDKLQALSA